jgi:hypothetical protein
MTTQIGNAVPMNFYGAAEFDGVSNARVGGSQNVVVARSATGVYTVVTADTIPRNDLYVDLVASGADGAAAELRWDDSLGLPTIRVVTVDPAGVPVNTQFQVKIWTLGATSYALTT